MDVRQHAVNRLKNQRIVVDVDQLNHRVTSRVNGGFLGGKGSFELLVVFFRGGEGVVAVANGEEKRVCAESILQAI